MTRRPNALEVSGWGDQPASTASNSQTASGKNKPLKRPIEGPVDNARSENTKRFRRANVVLYEPPAQHNELSEDLVLDGEEEDEEESPSPADEGQAETKPMRTITHFSVFDPKHQREMIPLSSMWEEDGLDRQYEATGFIRPYSPPEDYDEDEDGEDHEPRGIFVRLGAIMRYTVDLTKKSDPIWLETQHAWYSLDTPAEQYLPFYRDFYRPLYIVQHVFSWALQHPHKKMDAYGELVEDLETTVTFFGKTLVESDLKDAIPQMWEAVNQHAEANLRKNALVKGILNMSGGYDTKPVRRPTQLQPSGPPPQLPDKHRIRNPDAWVLDSNNQQRTHVTPRIALLARPYVAETLQVVGKRPKYPDPRELPDKQRPLLEKLIQRGRKDSTKNRLDWKGKIGSELAHCFIVDGLEYRVGDVVLLKNNNPAWQIFQEDEGPITLPSDATIADFFWFGQVQYIQRNDKWAHIQWFHHGSGILMAELADPQELFLAPNLCQDSKWTEIVGKVKVHWKCEPEAVTKASEFFCNFAFNEKEVSWTSLPSPTLLAALPEEDRCLPCHRNSIEETTSTCHPVRGSDATATGFTYRDKAYHLYDFVLYRGQDGSPASIGYIREIISKSSGTRKIVEGVKVRKVGRIVDLPLDMTPKGHFRDERELFMTKEKSIAVGVEDLIDVIYVPVERDVTKDMDLESWVALSPLHFYLKYQFPSLHPTTWGDRTRVNLPSCDACWKEKRREIELIEEFRAEMKREPLPTLDLYAGVGAFSRGIAEGSGLALEVTHAVEISPSAAETLRLNSPNATVYNQCANLMLRQVVKVDHGQSVDPLPEICSDERMCPPPLRKGDIKVIVAGFPCQGHSGMNHSKKVNDIKNNLLFNALSWVDHLRPDFVFMENVRGFMQTRLLGTQVDKHRIEGGVEKGVLKFLVKALLALGYQVRFALMQASHYGSPQNRQRFILVAALQGKPLPELPQPSHCVVTKTQSLEMKLPYSLDTVVAQPIRVLPSEAPHPSTTIRDSIGDLPRFDWKLPQDKDKPRKIDDKIVPAIECRYGKDKSCGISGPNPQYHSAPTTRLQLEARQRETKDIQHETSVLPHHHTTRVMAIAMVPGADSRCLPPELQTWSTANSMSANAKNNYRSGNFERLDFDKAFDTVVTNVKPTAKQSKVIHPDCKRIVTNRELARAQDFPDDFVFVSISGDPISIQRQIGNAVPLRLGRALGQELERALFERWKEERTDRRAVSDAHTKVVVEREVIYVESDSDE